MQNDEDEQMENGELDYEISKWRGSTRGASNMIAEQVEGHDDGQEEAVVVDAVLCLHHVIECTQDKLFRLLMIDLMLLEEKARVL
ncbi:hypothetical protein CASFOL_001333 [Castilleja foliolosa]|uniref:Uncharacterized protein n=1 Tax=Castilleja foliolosa TaxID=1961234 RepID=A0ABD3EM89_9LAMI